MAGVREFLLLIGIFAAVMAVVCIVVFILIHVYLYREGKKRKLGWKALVPFYNLILFSRNEKKTPTLLIVMLVIQILLWLGMLRWGFLILYIGGVSYWPHFLGGF